MTRAGAALLLACTVGPAAALLHPRSLRGQQEPASAIIVSQFALACSVIPVAERPAAVCGRTLLDPRSALDFVHSLPDGGDWGMPDAWTAMKVARAHFVLAGMTAWSDSAWDPMARLHRRPALEALTRALDKQPGFLPALLLLHTLSPYPQRWGTVDEELRQYRQVSLPKLPPSLYATRIMLALEAGRDSEAIAVHDSLFVRAPENADLRYLEAVIAAKTEPVAVAWRRYLAAVTAPGGAAIEGWPTYEAMLVADSAEKTDWDSTAVRDRPKWLQTFWELRDLQTAATPGTRWVTHQRRWRAALLRFRLSPEGGLHEERRPVELMQLPPTMVSDMDSTLEAGNPHLLPRGVYWNEPRVPGGRAAIVSRRVFDDRGLIFVRHGEPQQQVEYVSKLGMPDPGSRIATDPSGNPTNHMGDSAKSILQPISLNYVTWRYDNSEAHLIVSFGQMTHTTPAMWAFDFPRGGDLMSPCQADSRFCTALQSTDAKRLVRQDGHASLVQLAATDDVNPSFSRSAGLITETYGLAKGGVLVVYAIPVDAVLPKGSAAVTIRFAVASARPGVGLQRRIDTSRVYRVTPADSGHFLSGWFELPGTPGKLDVTVSAVTADSTIGSVRRHRDVISPEFSGRMLAISQPILGRDEAGISYPRHGELVALNPTNAWHRDELATVFYEVDGLVVGHMYETQFEFWKEGTSATKAQLTLSSEDQGGAPFATVQKALGLKELDPGSYRLVVHLRDTVTGAAASATGYINIVK